MIVIGSPESPDYHGTLTRGVVSGLRFEMGATLIQTDAAVSPGNSGSPMLDASSGEVIGVVQSKIIAEAVEGLGFGVAIGDAMRVLGIKVETG